MTTANTSWSTLLRKVPIDLVGVIVVVALANAATLVPLAGPLRLLAGVLFVLFVPGYALMAALFPEAGRSPRDATDRSDGSFSSSAGTRSSSHRLLDTGRGVDWFERLALSFGLSFALVPLLAMGVTLSPLAFSIEPIFLVISLFTVLCTVIAAIRRLLLPPEKRFGLPVSDWFTRGYGAIHYSESRGGLALNIVLVFAILFAMGTFGFAVLSPPDGEQYTEFYVLSEGENGELVSEGYPDVISPNDPAQLHVGIENHEKERAEYSVIVQVQRVESSDQETVVTERQTVEELSVELDHDERWVTEQEIAASDGLRGEDLRLKFLLYKGTVPDNPSSDSAHRDLHIWVDVDSSNT